MPAQQRAAVQQRGGGPADPEVRVDDPQGAVAADPGVEGAVAPVPELTGLSDPYGQRFDQFLRGLVVVHHTTDPRRGGLRQVYRRSEVVHRSALGHAELDTPDRLEGHLLLDDPLLAHLFQLVEQGTVPPVRQPTGEDRNSAGHLDPGRFDDRRPAVPRHDPAHFGGGGDLPAGQVLRRDQSLQHGLVVEAGDQIRGHPGASGPQQRVMRRKLELQRLAPLDGFPRVPHRLRAGTELPQVAGRLQTTPAEQTQRLVRAGAGAADRRRLVRKGQVQTRDHVQAVVESGARAGEIGAVGGGRRVGRSGQDHPVVCEHLYLDGRLHLVS
ncbi:hypothetical protein [Micromonospora sp. M42]|uniref:hypothetical protein n=1 Tax=Micromonospora sp. M42 TaxID=457406 RepID=UPI0018DE8A15|nr:hypothetical protein [Micromonospora sp. M42]